MATAWISTNTELSLVNTITQNLTLFLPQAPVNGKSLFIKDAAGNASRSTITVSTLGSDTFEDGSFFQTLNAPYESFQLNYSSNIWYFTGGNMFNTLRVSTLQANFTQTRNLSTANVSVSSFQLNDLRTSTIGTFNSVSSFLYYNEFNIGGGLRTAIPQPLNNYRFTPQEIPGLTLWYDGADQTTFTVIGGNVSQWNDKSGFNYHATQTSVANRPLFSTGTIVLDTAGKFLNLPVRTLFHNIPYASMFMAYNLTNLATPSIQRMYSFWTATSGGGNRFTIYFYNGTNPRTGVAGRAFQASGGFADGGTNLPLNTVQIINGEINYASNRINDFMNGSLYATGTLGTTANTDTSLGAFGDTIGTSFGISPGGSIIYELLFYKPQNPLTTIQRQQVEGYLAWKWGAESNLPASHPFRNAPP